VSIEIDPRFILNIYLYIAYDYNIGDIAAIGLQELCVGTVRIKNNVYVVGVRA